MKSFKKFFGKQTSSEKSREQIESADKRRELLKRLRYLKEKSDIRKSESGKTKSKRQP